MGNLWLKIRIWAKVLLFASIAIYVLVFVAKNSQAQVTMWVWINRSTTTSVLIFGLSSFLAWTSNIETNGWPQQLVDFIQGGEFKTWPGITQTKEALPEADDQAKVEEKFAEFDPRGPG